MDSYVCCDGGTPDPTGIVRTAPLLKLVAEENRLTILAILQGGEHCVCQIESHLDASQSLISHHLSALRTAGLIADRKAGANVHYRLTPEGERIIMLIRRMQTP